MYRVESMALAEKIVRRLGRAADPGKFCEAVRLNIEFEAGLNDRRADGIMSAAGAKCRNRAFVITMREAERIFRQRGMMEFWLGDVGHSAASLAAICRRSEIALVMNRAVTGVPS